MSRADKMLTLGVVAACGVCCAPLALGGLAAVVGTSVAVAGTAGTVGVAASGAPTWLLVTLAIAVLATTFATAHLIAKLRRRRRTGRRARSWERSSCWTAPGTSGAE